MVRNRRKKPPGYLYLVILAVIVIGLMFLFEWMGSEKPQRLVDKPLELPERYQEAIKAQEASDEAIEREGPGAL